MAKRNAARIERIIKSGVRVRKISDAKPVEQRESAHKTKINKKTIPIPKVATVCPSG